MTFKSKMMIAGATAILALAGVGGAAQAAGIVNGNFQSCTSGGSTGCNSGVTGANNITNDNGQSNAESLTGWTANGYAFVLTSGSSNPIPHSGFGGNDGTLKSLGSVPSIDRDFVAIDPVFDNSGGTSGISQTVTGLTAGLTYQLTFDWAGAQQSGFTGATTEWWTVDFGTSGNKTLDGSHNTSHTAVGNNSGNANPAFSGWLNGSFTFVASGASELITFLAEGTGTAEQPPFDLLANVNLTLVPPTTVPEPASIAMFGAGMIGLGGLAVARRRKKK